MSIDTETSADVNSSTAPPSTSPLLTSLLQNASGAANYPRDSTSPSKVSQFFNTSPLASAAAARQLSTDTPTSSTTSSLDKQADKQLPTSSPTLSKLLELPVTNTGNKLPPLPLVEATDQTSAEQSSEGRKEQVEDTTDKSTVTIKEEPMDTSDTTTQPEGEAAKKDASVTSQTEKAHATRRSRGRTTIAVSSAASTPSSGLTTRRSGRIKGLRESESEQTLEKKPSFSDDPTDASASEESLDALVKAQASSSKAPSISDSVPNSPASSTVHSDEADSIREHRRWKVAIMPLYKQAVTHMHAHWFNYPVNEKEAAGYHETIKRPMDLSTIKKKIEHPGENGIRNTVEFQRDMMLMFENALMYNKKDHEVYKAALEMQKEILDSIEDFIAGEKSSNLGSTGSSSSAAAATSSLPTNVTVATTSSTSVPATSGSTAASEKTETPHSKPSRASRIIKTEEQKKQPGSATVSTGTDSTTGPGRRRSRASTDEPTSSTATSTPVTRTMKKKTTN